MTLHNVNPIILILALGWLLFAAYIFRQNPTFSNVVLTLNSVGNQPTALIVLTMGCYMLIECKERGIDPTVAGSIIGVAANMLTNQFIKHSIPNEQSTKGETS